MASALLPRPGQVKELISCSLKILLLCDTENSLVKRVRNELLARNIQIETETVTTLDSMMSAAQLHEPDIIICPYMTRKIPEAVFCNPHRPCLIVHPGIAGDRGASSLDWAILEKKTTWGVTVIQAADIIDAGDIWSTCEFSLPDNSTKTAAYVHDVSDHAVDCVLDSVSRYCQNIRPLPCDYSNINISGAFKRNMKRSDRVIDWNMPAEEISRRTRMSDTQPGAVASLKINGAALSLRLFDAHEETGEQSEELQKMISESETGRIIGQKDGAVLIKTGDANAVWIGQMKKHIKLPSVEELKSFASVRMLPEITVPCAFEEIRVERSGPISFVYFDFYNGAMNKYQAARLERVLKHVGREDCRLVALMGGDRFFSTGIHLCAIENSENTTKEAIENINKINDVILAISELRDKVTIAVLRGNAGAGGEMLSAACDIVLSHPGVLVTPTYKAMCLHGSEYWTYFLPRRVGPAMAHRLVKSDITLSAEHAQHIGLVDELIGRERNFYKEHVTDYCYQLLYNGRVERIIEEKLKTRDDDWFKNLQKHREFELIQMRRSFQHENFLSAMKTFVYHKKGEIHEAYHFKEEKH